MKIEKINQEEPLVVTNLGLLRNELKSIVGEVFKDELSSLLANSQTTQIKEEESLKTLKQTAQFFDITQQTLRVWRHEGKLPEPVIKGRRVYFKTSDLMKLL